MKYKQYIVCVCKRVPFVIYVCKSVVFKGDKGYSDVEILDFLQ